MEFVVAADVFEDEAEDAAEEVFAEDAAEEVLADDSADESDAFEDAAWDFSDEAVDEAAEDAAEDVADETADEAFAVLEAACETGSEALELFEPDFPAQPVSARVNTAAAQSTEANSLFDLLIMISFLFIYIRADYTLFNRFLQENKGIFCRKNRL